MFLTDGVANGGAPLNVVGVFIVILREIDPNGAFEQHFIGRGRVILFDGDPSLLFERWFLNKHVKLDNTRFVMLSDLTFSSSSKIIEDNGTVTAASNGSSVTFRF